LTGDGGSTASSSRYDRLLSVDARCTKVVMAVAVLLPVMSAKEKVAVCVKTSVGNCRFLCFDILYLDGRFLSLVVVVRSGWHKLFQLRSTYYLWRPLLLGLRLWVEA
jgi:hypothetical protein